MHIILIKIFILLLSFNVSAIESNNNKLTCYAKHQNTNKEVAVEIVPGITKKNIATAQWHSGHPTIAIDNSAFLKLPKDARRFIYYHECAHLKYGIEDQYEADCKSLDLIRENHALSDIDIRKLVDTLVKELGMSRRWSELLQCDNSLQ
jgi:capsid portal protein